MWRKAKSYDTHRRAVSKPPPSTPKDGYATDRPSTRPARPGRRGARPRAYDAISWNGPGPRTTGRRSRAHCTPKASSGSSTPSRTCILRDPSPPWWVRHCRRRAPSRSSPPVEQVIVPWSRPSSASLYSGAFSIFFFRISTAPQRNAANGRDPRRTGPNGASFKRGRRENDRLKRYFPALSVRQSIPPLPTSREQRPPCRTNVPCARTWPVLESETSFCYDGNVVSRIFDTDTDKNTFCLNVFFKLWFMLIPPDSDITSLWHWLKCDDTASIPPFIMVAVEYRLLTGRVYNKTLGGRRQGATNLINSKFLFRLLLLWFMTINAVRGKLVGSAAALSRYRCGGAIGVLFLIAVHFYFYTSFLFSDFKLKY